MRGWNERMRLSEGWNERIRQNESHGNEGRR